jgi:hypothetical protein
MLAAVLSMPPSASALTAQEVTEKMSREQSFGYLAGLVDMSTYQAALSGNRARAQCIHDAFYTDIGRKGDAWERLDTALRQFPDKRAEGIVTLLIQKMCGS